MPLLTVLFVLSYGLMTLLIVEQGSVIQSQRNLIKVLSRDSSALWSERGKAIGDQQTAQAEAKTRTQTPTTQAPTTQEHSAQTPSTQNQTPSTPNQTPSTQVPQHRSQSRIGKTAKPERQLPPEPASDLVDRRRSLNSI
ncbi:MAG: hypothetical protein ABSB14_21025 [Candidatus Sulfotelmatobacter sp.]